ncbi:MAG TPA: hypothetical protein ENG95_04830 [Nitrospirae bacterium]|nr:hypothetical protein BMS3Abin09_01288 [bacterium BMS3Abin09]GBE41633.1 hypothetical protein BMS3Bbin09_01539 [bacterium BMS3Bbin09]HDO25945.1 hypothetical protein [Nitrospirota bacterium]
MKKVYFMILLISLLVVPFVYAEMGGGMMGGQESQEQMGSSMMDGQQGNMKQGGMMLKGHEIMGGMMLNMSQMGGLMQKMSDIMQSKIDPGSMSKMSDIMDNMSGHLKQMSGIMKQGQVSQEDMQKLHDQMLETQKKVEMMQLW